MTQKQSTKNWNQWLAGLIDGDGYLCVDKQNIARCEITVGIDDEYMLQKIKNQIPGSLKLRSGTKAVRLRISSKEALKDLVLRVNGEIRYQVRQEQFKQICQHFEIPYLSPKPLNPTNAYLAGLFDSDGTICFQISKTSQQDSQIKGEAGKIARLQNARGYHQLSISITSKNPEFLQLVLDGYGFGTIYTQKANPKTKHPNKLYRWVCQNRDDIDQFYNYFDQETFYSVKKKRLFLVPKYLELKSKKAHLVSEKQSSLRKIWCLFCQKWYS